MTLLDTLNQEKRVEAVSGRVWISTLPVVNQQEKERTTPRLIWPEPSFPFCAIEPLQFCKPALFLVDAGLYPRQRGVHYGLSQ